MNTASFPTLSLEHPQAADTQGLLLNYVALAKAVDHLAIRYQSNSPFAHIVLDDFVPQSTLEKLLVEYPYDQQSTLWNDASYKNNATGEYVQKDKRNIRDLLRMPATYRQLIWELNSKYFLDFLSKLSAISQLIPDPLLRGAGIHQIGRGGFLKIHADFTAHRDFGLDRRLNLLLYLNQDWPEEYGGHLELWDAQMQGPPQKILPIANRCVIFTTTATSYHGHPHPITCPPELFRKSIALYYYTNGRPTGEANPVFETLWKDLPTT